MKPETDDAVDHVVRALRLYSCVTTSALLISCLFLSETDIEPQPVFNTEGL